MPQHLLCSFCLFLPIFSEPYFLFADDSMNHFEKEKLQNRGCVGTEALSGRTSRPLRQRIGTVMFEDIPTCSENHRKSIGKL